MRASVGDRLLVHGRIVGQHDRTAEIIEVLGRTAPRPIGCVSRTATRR
ncbi:hypothetical protein OEIGOIKO_06794 [Streptomyces chrestomyceticus JCM 4735]|uniref:DUF1918 domain-containing protein n=1 Tax=Streptomyces chrestomyceticus JCM 4735 TaxID=1306181 RepID=A0A7U9L0V4_9ACTN|nr:hypothetical protein OEIGOIKO_06794 [Streptomyces chrestomyceticus JCM 4735]